MYVLGVNPSHEMQPNYQQTSWDVGASKFTEKMCLINNLSQKLYIVQYMEIITSEDWIHSLIK